MKFGHVVFEMCEWTDRPQTDTLVAILRPRTGGGGEVQIRSSRWAGRKARTRLSIAMWFPSDFCGCDYTWRIGLYRHRAYSRTDRLWWDASCRRLSPGTTLPRPTIS